MSRLPVFAALVFAGSLGMSSLVLGGVLDDFLREDQYLFCGVERYEEAYETTCAWDATARAAGNCNAPQYQDVVGKREIYRQCRSLFALGDGGPLPATAPADVPADIKPIWVLLKAVQPLAAKAVVVPPPACVSRVKPYVQRTQKADHVYFFDCMSQRDQAILKQLEQSNGARLVSAIEKALGLANTQNADTIAAAGELSLLLEDEGDKASLETVRDLLARFK